MAAVHVVLQCHGTGTAPAPAAIVEPADERGQVWLDVSKLDEPGQPTLTADEARALAAVLLAAAEESER